MAGQRLLLALDGSDHGARALERAVELAAALGCGLSIVHVLMHGRPAKELERMAEIEHLVTVALPPAMHSVANPVGMMGQLVEDADDREHHLRVIEALGEQVVKRAVERAAEKGVKDVRTHLESGDYADRILDIANEEGARMIIVGCRGLGRMRGRILGSVSQKVAQHAHCDVLIVK